MDRRLVVTPKSLVFSNSAAMANNCFSCSVSGAMISTAFSSGTGSARRSTLPFGVSGSLSSRI